MVGGNPFNLLDISLSLFYKYNLVGYGTLSDDLYCFNLKNDTSLNAMHVYVGTKRCVVNADSSMLCTVDWDTSPNKELND